MTIATRIIMHGHHAYSLFSFLPSLEGRQEEVRRIKPPNEVELRLALMQDVTDLLPKTKAWAALDKARAALDKLGAALDKARTALDKLGAARALSRAAYDKARTAYLKSFDVDAFHSQHCHLNCPWNGTTIFSKGTGIEVLSPAEDLT